MSLIMSYGCASQPTSNPFVVEKAKIYENVHSIAIMPISLPDFVQDPEEIGDRYEKLMVEKLKKGNFSVVRTKEWVTIFKRMKKDVGGFYDPMSGAFNEEKFKTIRDLSLREFAGKQEFDAFLHSQIVVRELHAPPGALLIDPDISWDGKEETASGAQGRPQQIQPFVIPIIIPTAPQRYKIYGLSLITILTDRNDQVLYSNIGGIQLLHKWSKGDAAYVGLQAQFLFLNKENDKHAVELAMNPLIEGLIAHRP